MIERKIVFVADLLAIPFFMLLVYYLYTKEDKELIHSILLMFAIVGLIVDVVFTIDYLNEK